MKQINRRFITLSIIAALLTSCMKEGACPTGESIHYFKILIPSLNGSSDIEDMNAINKLDAYIFNYKGEISKHITNLNTNPDGIVQLNIDITDINTIYFIANYPDIPEDEIGTEANLKNRTTTPSSEMPDTFFMTSIYTPNITRSAQENIVFARSVSRIDLDMGNNTLLEIDSITIDHMPDRTYLFPNSDEQLPENTSLATYKKTFSPSLSVEKEQLFKGVFLVYENGMNVANLSVYGRYNGTSTRINLTIPQIKRNYLYTIILEPVGQTINGTIKVEEWKEGEDINAGFE